MQRMEKTKQFLEDYKIFFETIVMLILTVMGIIVSLSANSIANKQTEIEEVLARPIISLETGFDKDGNTIEYISINNVGSALLDEIELEVLPYYYITLFVEEEDRGYKLKSLLLPIENSIFPVFELQKYNTKTGTIITMKRGKVIQEHIDDMEVFRKYMNEGIMNGVEMAFLSLECFIQVHYTDHFGNSTKEIYQCVTGNEKTYSSSIQFIRDVGINSIAQGGHTYELFKNMYQSKKITNYVRYGETESERYDNFSRTLSNAFKQKQLLME